MVLVIKYTTGEVELFDIDVHPERADQVEKDEKIYYFDYKNPKGKAEINRACVQKMELIDLELEDYKNAVQIQNEQVDNRR